MTRRHRRRCPVCRGPLPSCDCRTDLGGLLAADPLDLGAVDAEPLHITAPRSSYEPPRGPFGAPGRDGAMGEDPFAHMERDLNGCAMERRHTAFGEVIVHYDDIPASDRTVVNGIPCTTVLRTVIDVAPEIDRTHLRLVVDDVLERQLLTVEEARRRIDQPDMVGRPGAELLRTELAER